MDIATTSVFVKRETKTSTFTPVALLALATTAMQNAVDPDGAATFVDHVAKANEDGSITVSLSIETEQPDVSPSTPTAPSAPVAVLQPVVPAINPPSA